MMATIAVRLLNVHVPTLLLVGSALVGALALGGAALSGDRKRQLDKSRGDAIAALRATVEEFRLSLAKQLRDASRALQQELRRESGAAAARGSAAAAKELDIVRRVADDDRRSADELATIARDLTALGELRRRAQALGARLAAGETAGETAGEAEGETAGGTAQPVTDPARDDESGGAVDGAPVVRRLHVVA